MQLYQFIPIRIKAEQTPTHCPERVSVAETTTEGSFFDAVNMIHEHFTANQGVIAF